MSVLVKKLFFSILGWFIGVFLFIGLNVRLLIKKFTLGDATQKRLFERTQTIKLNSPIILGELPDGSSTEKRYQIPKELAPQATKILLEIKASSQPSQELEFSIQIENHNDEYFFLFSKPFGKEPQISYISEKILIDIPESRIFKIRFEGDTGTCNKFGGEVKIIGYC